MSVELVVSPAVSVGVLILVFILSMSAAYGLARWARAGSAPPPVEEDGPVVPLREDQPLTPGGP